MSEVDSSSNSIKTKLERNRESASRYRGRQKQYVAGLEERVETLVAEVARLRETEIKLCSELALYRDGAFFRPVVATHEQSSSSHSSNSGMPAGLALLKQKFIDMQRQAVDGIALIEQLSSNQSTHSNSPQSQTSNSSSGDED